MDSHLVCLCQLILLFVASSGSWRVKANHQFPTIGYSYSLNAKQAKEDLKQRRQHARRSQPISLKPPPEDWPEPPMADADRLMDASSQQRVTSLSPMLVYQARLEQELLEQQQEDQNLSKPKIEKRGESSIEISLDDDFKKLLDPKELLKHNKQLKPFVSMGGQKPLEIVKSAGEQGKKNTKSGGISSLTALKAKSSKRKPRPAVYVAEGVIGKVAPRKCRKPKHIVQKETLEEKKPLLEANLKEIKIKETLTEKMEKVPLKRRRKKKRTFAFANQPYFETDLEQVVDSTTVPDNSRFENGQITTTTTQPKTTNTTAKTIKSYIQETSTSMKGSIQETTTEQGSTTDRATFSLERPSKRLEIWEKRKQVKKEMKKVLDVEQLEGSFSDKESDWTSSEEEFYVEYYEMNKAVKNKIEALRKVRTTIKPDNVTTIKNIYKNIIQLIN